jgi:hypothetical protein
MYEAPVDKVRQLEIDLLVDVQRLIARDLEQVGSLTDAVSRLLELLTAKDIDA